jgi:hypothetical protein
MEPPGVVVYALDFLRDAGFFFGISFRILFTTVRFTDHLITVRVFPFTSYSESSRDVASLSAHPGNLRIRFASGKKLDLWAGLGNARKIALIFQKRAAILPNTASH